MKLLAALGVLVAVGLSAQAADIEAGKAGSEACAACHGANGISVSDEIPNLAGQKAKYLEAQLKAFKEGKRTNELMNAIAAQLADAEIANLAAYFASQQGGTGSDKSDIVAAFEASRVSFPDDYASAYTKYTTISFPARQQVRHYFANQAALDAAAAGKPMPHGAKFLVEIHTAELDGSGAPVKGEDGQFVADKLVAFTAMETQAGWGTDFPEILRNGDWNYAVFSADGKPRPGVNQAPCLACHKPLADDSYVFSLKALKEQAGAR